MFPDPLDRLTMGRTKRRSLVTAVAYRLNRVGVRLFGQRTMLRLHLFSSWLFSRFALELAQDVYGHDFRDRLMGVTDELLQEHCSSAVVVDVGCGTGRLCRRVAPWARQVVGVDQDPVRLDIARRTASASNVTYRLADATMGLDRASGLHRADVVLAIHVVEHIDDAEGFLRELQTFTDTVILEVPDFAGDPLNAARWTEGMRWYSDADHVREYTMESLEALVASAGWETGTVVRRGGTIAAVVHHRI